LSQLPEGSDASAAKRDVMDAVRAHFRPEFLNRLDDQIIFDRLSRDDMDGIVRIQLKRLESGWPSARSRWRSTRPRCRGWPTKGTTRCSVRVRSSG
jgi:ATP-dependent Clp protease ATP-binding subunit ClpA